jgi:hypothetical protein
MTSLEIYMMKRAADAEDGEDDETPGFGGRLMDGALSFGGSLAGALLGGTGGLILGNAVDPGRTEFIPAPMMPVPVHTPSKLGPLGLLGGGAGGAYAGAYAGNAVSKWLRRKTRELAKAEAAPEEAG